jgi:hypothetical protein
MEGKGVGGEGGVLWDVTNNKSIQFKSLKKFYQTTLYTYYTIVP